MAESFRSEFITGTIRLCHSDCEHGRTKCVEERGQDKYYIRKEQHTCPPLRSLRRLPGGCCCPQKPRLQEPKLYRVLLHNDNYTTMDFVVKVIVAVFHKGGGGGTKIMLDIHQKGHGVVGVYTTISR